MFEPHLYAADCRVDSHPLASIKLPIKSQTYPEAYLRITLEVSPSVRTLLAKCSILMDLFAPFLNELVSNRLTM